MNRRTARIGALLVLSLLAMAPAVDAQTRYVHFQQGNAPGAWGMLEGETIRRLSAPPYDGGTPTGQSVALIDTEPNYGDVAVLMDINDVPLAQSVSQVARRSDQMDRDSVLDYLFPHPSGVMVLPTATHLDIWQQVQPLQVQQVVRLIAQTQDFVILDTPSGLNNITAAALEVSPLALLVTTPEITSIKDTMLALNLINTWGLDREKIKVVMNHTSSNNGVRRDDVKLVLEHEVFWSIPYDSVVSNCSVGPAGDGGLP